MTQNIYSGKDAALEDSARPLPQQKLLRPRLFIEEASRSGAKRSVSAYCAHKRVRVGVYQRKGATKSGAGLGAGRILRAARRPDYFLLISGLAKRDRQRPAISH